MAFEKQTTKSRHLSLDELGLSKQSENLEPARTGEAAAKLQLPEGDHSEMYCLLFCLAGTHLLELGVGLAFRLTPILGRPAPENTPSPAPDHG